MSLSEGYSRLDVEFVKLFDISKGFGKPLLPERGFEFFHNAALCVLLGDALCELACGGMRLGGERGIVAFRIDLTEGGKADCFFQALAIGIDRYELCKDTPDDDYLRPP